MLGKRMLLFGPCAWYMVYFESSNLWEFNIKIRIYYYNAFSNIVRVKQFQVIMSYLVQISLIYSPRKK